MVVYKFGGASVANAEKIKNVADIIQKAGSEQLFVVISAMGKTTNALEVILEKSRNGTNSQELLEDLIRDHQSILKALFPSGDGWTLLDDIFAELGENLAKYHTSDYDFAYDQIISLGEIISTLIVSKYLDSIGIRTSWIDAREIIKTDSTYREGIVDWTKTQEAIGEKLNKHADSQILITQGFIGSDENSFTTTLGREGSDYTAAIISYCVDAEKMAIWKDVPGVLTADPRLFENVAKIDRLSYKEAIEMTYYGAKVIHPKTIKPLQNKSIPLWVNSFLHPASTGTLISGEIELTYPPMIVIEPAQALIHISTKDFSFVSENHLSKLFKIFNRHRVKVNMMRNTAISFSVCSDDYEKRISRLHEDLKQEFNMVVDRDLELITIRHYTEELVTRLKRGKIILFEERLQQTIQMVTKDVPDMKRKEN